MLSSLGSLIATLLFLQVWRPAPDPEFAIKSTTAVAGDPATSSIPNWQGWLPWVVVSATVIFWTSFKFFAIGQQNITWPGLHRAISITLYNGKPYDAIWAFQPLGTGTAILLAAIITALLVRLSPRAFFSCYGETIRQCWLAVVTVMLIVGLALQLPFLQVSESMGNHDSKIVDVDADSID